MLLCDVNPSLCLAAQRIIDSRREYFSSLLAFWQYLFDSVAFLFSQYVCIVLGIGTHRSGPKSDVKISICIMATKSVRCNPGIK